MGKLVRAANLAEKFARLDLWIEMHLREDLGISSLAELTRMSERSFERRYIEIMGRTPRAFVEEIRVATACRLLEGSRTASLDQIAVDVGLRSEVNLRRAFIRRLGMTADAWRELEEATRPGGRRMSPEDELKLLDTVDTIDKRLLCLSVHLDRQVAFLLSELREQLDQIERLVGGEPRPHQPPGEDTPGGADGNPPIATTDRAAGDEAPKAS
jgi:AraC-like DNA-binding protein